MNAQQLAELCNRIRSLFGQQIDEDIWAIQRRWLRERDASVCNDALDEYAMDFGGSLGKFIPSKFREHHDRHASRHAERRRKESDAENMRRMMQLGVNGSDIEWASLKSRIRALDPVRVEDATKYLEQLGWIRPPDADPRGWSRSWILAVVDLAEDRPVMGIPARDFYRRAYPSRSRVPSDARKDG